MTSSSFSHDDRQYMARALKLARKGLYTTDPNPRVGCVLVKNGTVIGEGFHQRAGEGHAEVNALAAATDPRGATAYVTLEPCSHQGKTPPCARALIDAGVARVVSAMEDPNPLVAGQGHARLRQAGIEVASGLLESEAKALNPGFCRRIAGGLPWVRVKQACSLDGRTAMASGESQWITGPAARSDVQRLRARSSAIITGTGTLLADDPALTLRAGQLGLDDAQAADICRRQPYRAVMDHDLKTPPDSKILQDGGETLIFYCHDRHGRGADLEARGATLIQLAELAPRAVLQWLARERQCNEVLIEAGPVLAGAFTRADLVDEWWIYMAPTLLGHGARPLLQLSGLERMADQIRLEQQDLRMVGNDIRMIYQKPSQER